MTAGLDATDDPPEPAALLDAAVVELVAAGDVLEVAAAGATEVLELELVLPPQAAINAPPSTAIAPSAHSLLIMLPPSRYERSRSVPTAPARRGANSPRRLACTTH
jgi:hypothetical protein